jgi:outer membrane biosynthesis protein TonB
MRRIPSNKREAIKELERSYHNVSVRLNDIDYEILQRVLEKHYNYSYGKVGLADVLRNALIHLFLTELKEPDIKAIDVKANREEAHEIVLRELIPQFYSEEQEEVIKVDPKIKEEVSEEITEEVIEETDPNQTTIDEYIEEEKEEDKEEPKEEPKPKTDIKTDIKMTLTEEEQKQLESYEKLLRSQKNSKGKEYSEKWIKQRMNGKLNDIISKRE